MLVTKESQYRVATLLPLYMGSIYKKEDIMDIAERDYLDTSSSDFGREILDGKSSGRKLEEWVIQNSFRAEYICRIKTGYYKITTKGKTYIEDFSAKSAMGDMDKISDCTLLTEKVVNELKAIYQVNESAILAREAARIRSLLSND